MTPHGLIAAFDTVAEVPDGVVRLRELVLQLAVRGKLVPQDPTDEPASVLLKRAKSLKGQAVARGDVPMPQALSDRLAEVTPLFDVPRSWQWARLDDVGLYIQRGKSPEYDDASSARVVSQKCVQWSGFDLTRSRGVLESSLAEYGPERFLRCGDVLWNSTGTGTVGRVNCFPGVPPGTKVVADSHVMVIRVAAMNPAFVCAWLASPAVQDTIGELTTGTTKQQELSTSTVRLHCIPVPPLAEQHRIVARVDELMRLLDRLETAQTTRDATRSAARDSVLDALREADATYEVEVAWNRFAERMGDLLRDPEDIAPVRQTILELAVRGRLVAQDLSEGTGESVIEDVRRERSSLVKKGLLRGLSDKLPSVVDSPPFPIPVTWTWARAADICLVITDGDHQPPPQVPEGIPFVVIGNVNRGCIDLTDTRRVPQDYFDALEWTRKPCRGDLLYTVTGSYGIVVEVGDVEPFCVQRHIGIIKTARCFDNQYLAHVLRSAYALTHATDVATGIAQKTVPLSGLRRLPVPVPSLAEQRRIVARVNELMGLLDRLEVRLAAARTAHVAFAAAAVHHLDA